MSLYYKIRSNILYFLFNIPNTVINFFGGLYLFSILSPDDFGKIAIIISTLEIFSIFGAFRIDQLYYNRNIQDKGREIGIYLILNGFIAIISMVLSLLFYGIFKRSALPLNDFVLILYFALEKIILSISTIYYIESAKKWEKHKLEIIGSIFSVLGMAAAIFFAKNGWGFWSLIIKHFIISFFPFLFYVFFYPLKIKLRISWNDIQWYYLRGKELFISNIVSSLAGRIDDILIGYGVSETILGYYDRSFQINRFPSQIVNSFIGHNYPLLIEKQGNKTQFLIIFKTITIINTFIITILLTNGLFVIYQLSYYLEGNWIVIIRFSAILYVYSLGKSIIDLTYNYMVVSKKYSELKKTYMIFGTIVIFINILFFLLWSYWGVVVAQGFSMFVSSIYILKRNRFSLSLLAFSFISIFYFAAYYCYLEFFYISFFSFINYFIVLSMNIFYILTMIIIYRHLIKDIYIKMVNSK